MPPKKEERSTTAWHTEVSGRKLLAEELYRMLDVSRLVLCIVCVAYLTAITDVLNQKNTCIRLLLGVLF